MCNLALFTGLCHIGYVLCRVLQVLAGGTAALVQWQLRTGRTHQIRVHAQHMGCPLLGDDLYGGVGPSLPKVARGSEARCATLPMLFHANLSMLIVGLLGTRT